MNISLDEHPLKYNREIIDVLLELVESSSILLWSFTLTNQFDNVKSLGKSALINIFKTETNEVELINLYQEVIVIHYVDNDKYNPNDILFLVESLYCSLSETCTLYDRYPTKRCEVNVIDTYIQDMFQSDLGFNEITYYGFMSNVCENISEFN